MTVKKKLNSNFVRWNKTQLKSSSSSVIDVGKKSTWRVAFLSSVKDTTCPRSAIRNFVSLSFLVNLRIGSCLAWVYRVMDASGKFGEHERSVRVACSRLSVSEDDRKGERATSGISVASGIRPLLPTRRPPAFSIIYWQRAWNRLARVARSRVWFVQNNLHISETKGTCTKLDGHFAAFLKLHTPFYWTRPCVHKDFVHGDGAIEIR